MSRQEYGMLQMVWAERDVTVRYMCDWLNSGYWHIELCCNERLPVTATGYRSLFVPTDAIAGEGVIREFVANWLDNAAKDTAWLRYQSDSRQLKLF